MKDKKCYKLLDMYRIAFIVNIINLATMYIINSTGFLNFTFLTTNFDGVHGKTGLALMGKSMAMPSPCALSV
jgi:hypothetical protein